MSKTEKYITLYPSHWLYNAGILGLLHLDELEGIEGLFLEDGNIKVPRNYFDKINIGQRFFDNGKTLEVAIIGKSPLYPNFINSSRKQDKESFHLFVKALNKIKNDSQKVCGSCTQNFALDQQEIEKLNNEWSSEQGDFNKFYEGILEFSNKYHAEFGGAISKFPNGFWNLESTINICPLCSFIILHHHLALIKLQNNSKVFVNGHSFEIIYHLNRFVNEIMGRLKKDDEKDKREILAMSIIEYSTKIKSTLGIWSMMNIEIISKYVKRVGNSGNYSSDFRNVIDSYSLPTDVLNLISDRKIASQLSSIGEFKILNLVLDRKFKNLIEIGYRLMREALSQRKNTKYIEDILYLHRNRNDLLETANQILKLYALIEDKYQTSKHKYFNYG